MSTQLHNSSVILTAVDPEKKIFSIPSELLAHCQSRFADLILAVFHPRLLNSLTTYDQVPESWHRLCHLFTSPIASHFTKYPLSFHLNHHFLRQDH